MPPESLTAPTLTPPKGLVRSRITPCVADALNETIVLNFSRSVKGRKSVHKYCTVVFWPWFADKEQWPGFVCGSLGAPLDTARLATASTEVVHI